MYMERRRGGKKMRRTKRFAGFALAACMGVSLLVNVPVGVGGRTDRNGSCRYS